MKSKLSILILFSAIQLGIAQNKWSVEFRPGLHIPVNDLGEDNLELGFGFDMKVGYLLMPHLRAYSGWGLSLFETEEVLMNNKTRLRENSFVLGAELLLPIEQKSVTYFVFAGGILGQVRLEDSMKTFSATSNFRPGWQAGAGVEIHLDAHWDLKPNLRFRSLKQEVNTTASQLEVDLDYFSIAMGLTYIFN